MSAYTGRGPAATHQWRPAGGAPGERNAVDFSKNFHAPAVTPAKAEVQKCLKRHWIPAQKPCRNDERALYIMTNIAGGAQVGVDGPG